MEAVEQPGPCNKISFYSNLIEFIILLADDVRKTIVNEIHRTKFVDISIDCTPDMAHSGQMTQIIK